MPGDKGLPGDKGWCWMTDSSARVDAPRLARHRISRPLLVVGWLVVAGTVALALLPLFPASEGMHSNLVEVMGPPLVLLALPLALIVCHRAQELSGRLTGVGLLAGVGSAFATFFMMLLTSGENGRVVLALFAGILLGGVVVWGRRQQQTAAGGRTRAPVSTVIIFVAVLGLAMVGTVAAVVGQAEEVATMLVSIAAVLALALVSRTAVARIVWGSAFVGLLGTIGLLVLSIAITDETEFLLALPVLVVIGLLMWWHVRPALRELRGA